MDQFRVWITFETGDSHLDTDWCDQTTLLSSLRRLLHGPVAQTGVITEIKVVDMSDSIVYLVQNGKQIWPEGVAA